MRRLAALALAAAAAVSCGDTERVEPLAALGAELANNPRVTRSQYNVFACTTCHAERAGSAILPGAPLRGAARRPSYWGGEVLNLREAVERCWVGFMRGDPADLDGPNGRALDAWLASLAPAGSAEGAAAVPMTYPRTIADPGDGGDRARGLSVWGRACARCHGAIETGAGRLGPLVSIVPRDTETEHCDDDLSVTSFTDHRAYIRAVSAEKSRHGSFAGYAGVMPPFSNEVLSDADLRDLAAFFTCPTM